MPQEFSILSGFHGIGFFIVCCRFEGVERKISKEKIEGAFGGGGTGGRGAAPDQKLLRRNEKAAGYRPGHAE